MSGAEKGTAMHFVMQKIDYEKVESLNDIKLQLEDMVKNELLTKDEFKAINPFKVLNFFKSDIGKRVIKVYENGGVIRRELPFYTSISVKDIKDNIEDESGNENVRLQGIIDLFFEENGEIVLVDYKTDYVKENIEEEMNKKYKIQMDYYTKALEKMTGKVVSKRYLYLFYLEKAIEI